LLLASSALLMSGGFTNHYTMSVLVGFDTTSEDGMRIWREHSANLILASIMQQPVRLSPTSGVQAYQPTQRPLITSRYDLPTARRKHASPRATGYDCQSRHLLPGWFRSRRMTHRRQETLRHQRSAAGFPVQGSGDCRAEYLATPRAWSCGHFLQVPSQ